MVVMMMVISGMIRMMMMVMVMIEIKVDDDCVG